MPHRGEAAAPTGSARTDVREAAIRPEPLAARIEAMRRRHRAIDRTVQAEHLRPLPDAALLSVLKRKRLRLKDEMRSYEGLLRVLARTPAA